MKIVCCLFEYTTGNLILFSHGPLLMLLFKPFNNIYRVSILTTRTECIKVEIHCMTGHCIYFCSCIYFENNRVQNVLMISQLIMHVHMLVQLVGFGHPQDLFGTDVLPDTFRRLWYFVASICFAVPKLLRITLATTRPWMN